MSAREHYATLLGGIYRWSVSGQGDPVQRAADWLTRNGLDDADSYLDLGAGFGAHTLPLARAGKRVTAVDFDATLLAELSAQLPAPAHVNVVHEDFVSFLQRQRPATWDVVLCLGDTLTHLSDHQTVRRLLALVAPVLRPSGRLVLSYRNYARTLPDDVERFIPVRRDATRIMHCFVEGLNDERLRITDLVTELSSDGPTTRISSYQKLRLGPDQLAGWAHESGLRVASSSEQNGLVVQQLSLPGRDW